MPIKILRPNHTELVGSGYVLLLAPHSAGPDADLHMGQIVEDAALASRAYAVIGKISKEFFDLNKMQTAESDFRKSIDSLIDDEGVRFILDIHGKSESGVDLGSALGKTSTEDSMNLIRLFLSKNFKVTVSSTDQDMKERNIAATYERMDSQGQFLVQSVQVEFGPEERTFERDKVVNDVAELVGLINVKLGFVPSESPKSAEN